MGAIPCERSPTLQKVVRTTAGALKALTARRATAPTPRSCGGPPLLEALERAGVADPGVAGVPRQSGGVHAPGQLPTPEARNVEARWTPRCIVHVARGAVGYLTN